MKANFVKHGGGWFPADEEARELQRRWRQGEEVCIDLKKSRNPRFHRYVFRGLQFMHDCADVDVPFDPWRKDLMILAGYRKVYAIGSRTYVEAESLSFESMTEERFHEVFNDLINTYFQHYGERVDQDKIIEVAML